MNGALLRINDQVILTAESESVIAGHDPYPKGSKAKVIGFKQMVRSRIHNRFSGATLKPGIYFEKEDPILLMEDGCEHVGWAQKLELADKEEYSKREHAWRESNEFQFLSDLPETSFWEGDKVRIQKEGETIFLVIEIDYENSYGQGAKSNPGYNILNESKGWSTYVPESEMKLVERGNLWRYYHKEPLKFANLQEEVNFFILLGQYDQLRNPATGGFHWKKNEALRAIENGIADCFTVDSRFSAGREPFAAALKLHDPKLGRRIAAEILKNFGQSP